MSEIIQVTLTSLNGNDTSGDVLLNVDNIETVFTSNNQAFIDYNFKGTTRRIGVTQSKPDLIAYIGSYTAGRTMVINTLTKDGFVYNSQELVKIDELVWGDSINEDDDTFRLIFQNTTYVCSGSPASFLASANRAIVEGDFVGAYNTEDRPLASEVGIGKYYFDTIKKYPLYSDGVYWVNATGTEE